MREHSLYMRVNCPPYGVGTIEEIRNGYIKVRFDKDNIVKYIPEKKEPFIAAQQKRIQEKW